jgi:NTP pyrophosphatase (non-canonical NTP hydrolase)
MRRRNKCMLRRRRGVIAKTLSALTDLVVRFRDDRDWKQFHTPKDLVISLLLESSELLEIAQWRTDRELAQRWEANPNEVGDELADILYWLLLIAHETGVDLEQHFLRKLKANELKYPANESRGKKDKYTSYSERPEKR